MKQEIYDVIKDLEHARSSLKVNLYLIPKILCNPYDDKMREIFNAVYFYQKELPEMDLTKSGGYAFSRFNLTHDTKHLVIQDGRSIEVILCTSQGCWRFICEACTKEYTTTGRHSYLALKKRLREIGINLENYAVEDGEEIKKTIHSPIIELATPLVTNHTWENVHHLDLNSAYWSSILDVYPEFSPVVEHIYKNKNKSELNKLMMNAPTGFFQSKYCIINHKKFALANLSKIAVDGCVERMNYYIKKLKDSGRVPLLYNTDGIWYKGKIFHDAHEGKELHQWKNDHKNCKLTIKSKGAYQFIENGVVNTVVRGVTRLDRVKPDRSTWEFGEIYTELCYIITWYFNEEDGVVVERKDV